MGTLNSNSRFVVEHAAGAPDDPNLASPADLAAFLTDSTTSSLVASRLVSTSASGALDSVPVSTADSKAVSSGLRGSIADSKAISGSVNISVADSKAQSVSSNTSIADSKAVSVATATPTLTVVAASQSVSSADSKAVSVATVTSVIRAQVVNVMDAPYNAVGNGSADDTNAILSAIAAAPEGSTITSTPGSSHKITAVIPVTKGLTFQLDGVTITQATAGAGGFTVSASNVHFRRGKIAGTQHASQSANENAIAATGASAASPLSNVTIEDVEIDNWGMHGILLTYVNDFGVLRNKLSNLYYTGIGTVSCIRGTVQQNKVKTVVGTPLAYGIFFARNSTASLVTDPRSADILCANNDVQDVPNWEGLDTHAGQRISFIGNNVKACKKGIVVGPATDGANPTFAPLDVNVMGGSVDSLVTDGSMDVGILFQGAGNTVGSPVELATGSVIGVTVRGHGDQSNSISAAIILQTTRGVVVMGNPIIEPSPHGVFLYHDNYEQVVWNNPVTDAWSTTQANTSAVHVNSDYQTGSLGGNSLSHGSKSATHLNVWGLRVGSSLSNSLMQISANRFAAATTPYSIQTNGAVDTNNHISALAIGSSGAAITKHLSATRTWDPSSVASLGNTTVTVNVSGAAVGDTVTVGFTPTIQGMILTGHVSSSGVVTVVLFNPTGGAIDLGSGTLRADVWQH